MFSCFFLVPNKVLWRSFRPQRSLKTKIQVIFSLWWGSGQGCFQDFFGYIICVSFLLGRIGRDVCWWCWRWRRGKRLIPSTGTVKVQSSKSLQQKTSLCDAIMIGIVSLVTLSKTNKFKSFSNIFKTAKLFVKNFVFLLTKTCLLVIEYSLCNLNFSLWTCLFIVKLRFNLFTVMNHTLS